MMSWLSPKCGSSCWRACALWARWRRRPRPPRASRCVRPRGQLGAGWTPWPGRCSLLQLLISRPLEPLCCCCLPPTNQRSQAVNSYQRLSALLRGEYPPGLLPPTPQGYLAARVRQLAEGSCMAAFDWSGGGEWGGKRWSPELPTDSALVFYLFAAYLAAPQWLFPQVPACSVGVCCLLLLSTVDDQVPAPSIAHSLARSTAPHCSPRRATRPPSAASPARCTSASCPASRPTATSECSPRGRRPRPRRAHEWPPALPVLPWPTLAAGPNEGCTRAPPPFSLLPHNNCACSCRAPLWWACSWARRRRCLR